MLLGKRLYTLLMFVLVSTLSGVLVAGLAAPSVGLASVTGRDAITGVNDLPAELEAPPQWERSRLLLSNQKTLAYFYDQNRVYVQLNQISDSMKMAQVGIEDHRFYEHGALDLTGTLRALVSTSQGNTQGGSSLTQQYVRMVLVEKAEATGDKVAAAAATENSLARKVRELRYAVAVEKEFSKDQILEFYLNMAYYGDGAYGVEAAARHYFGVNASKLDLAQSAMLAGLVRNPVATNPVRHTVVALSRRNDVLDRLTELKKITPEEAKAAKATTFDKSKVVDSRTGCANSQFPFVCDYALRTLVKQTPSLGATEEERMARVYRGGLTIQTQIDEKAQLAAEKAISKFISGKDPVVSVVTMIQPGTGLILAMAQNRQEMGKKPGQTFWNYAAPNNMGGAFGFQAGSTFKIFTAAAALDSGMGANIDIQVQKSRNYQGQTFKSCDGPFKVGSRWVVDGPQAGGYNLWSGTKGSVNNYFVPLEQRVGICPVVKMAQRVGLKAANGEDLVANYNYIASFTLGVAGISPLSLTEAYATFAARGVHCDPIILKSIVTKDNVSLAVPDAGCKQVISRELADTISQIFRGPYNGGTASAAKVPGVDMAGKTGTVPDNRAIWTMGFTPDLAAAAMISYDSDPVYKKFWDKRRGRYLQGVHLKYSGRTLQGSSGQEAGGRLLKPSFAAAISDVAKPRQFGDADRAVLNGRMVDVPPCVGIPLATCIQKLKDAGFEIATSAQYSTVPNGMVADVVPKTQAGKGTTVMVTVSRGPDPTRPAAPVITPPPATPRKR